MATVTIPDAVYSQLATRASALSMSVEDLLPTIIERAITPLSRPLTGDDWLREFERWNQEIQSRRHRYPEGYTIADDRESIYDERLNAQR